MKRYTSCYLASLAMALVLAHPARANLDPDGALTLNQALDLALAHNPELAAAEQGALAAEGNARQAGACQNPELEIEAEEFGGSETRKGFDSAQMTARISQPIELGGKISGRKALSRTEAHRAALEAEAMRLEVRNRTKQAFVEVLRAQAQVALAREALTLAEDVRRIAAERVKAGKVSELEETKAGVEALSAGLAFDQARRDLDLARLLLAANWNSGKPLFTEAAGSLENLPPSASLDQLMEALDESPEMARWVSGREAGKEALALAKAQRIPDVSVSAGIRRFEEDGSHAAVASIALPLPLFDRNTGGIQAAQHQATRADHEHEAARLRAATRLAETHAQLENSRTLALAIRESLLPAAQKSFEASQAGYRQGKSALLDVLDAQRTLNEARAGQGAALAAFHKAAAELEALTGQPFETLQP